MQYFSRDWKYTIIVEFVCLKEVVDLTLYPFLSCILQAHLLVNVGSFKPDWFFA
jgi:hypothetical protein